MASKGDCQSVQVVSAHALPGGGELEQTNMSTSDTKNAFENAKNARQYKAALAKARRLGGKKQLAVLDSMFAAADRLGVERSTGEPLGMQQQLDGSVTVTWEMKTRRPDGTEFRTVSSAVLEPCDSGAGWRSRTKDVPEEVVEAVTAAAMAEQLKPKALAAKRRRVYVR